MAKAKKLKSGNWRCLVYDYTDSDGKRHYESFTARTKKEAEYMAAEFALTKKQIYRSDKTFGQALEKYILMRENVSSPRTIVNYRRIQHTDLKPLLDIKISDINQDIIQKFVNDNAVTHSPKTVRDNHGLISAVLKQERPDFALNTVLPKRIRSDIYIPSDNDVSTIIKLARNTELELPIMLAAFGPMRRGEICALRADCINGNTVHVRRNMVLGPDRQWIIKSPKTYSGDRYIEFPDFVAELLAQKTGTITDLNPDALTCRFRRLIKRSGVPHFRFHDLRHYCASIQHALGIPDAYIMQRGGWQNDGILKAVYRHTMDQQEQAMNMIANSHFTEMMQHEMQHKKIKP